MRKYVEPNRVDRRTLYRQAKKTLYRALVRRWKGSRAGLDRHIRRFLRGKRRTYLLRLVRRHAFALAVATAVLTGATAHASPPIELSDIAMDANSGGFVISGIDAGDAAGHSVSGAGDVNGDGIPDLIVGAWRASPEGKIFAGESYVVFGKASGAAVELSDVALGTGGFIINGIGAIDSSGFSVSGAGDVNGDGLADLIVGAIFAAGGGITQSGESYVVFGKASTTPVELSDVAAGMGGFIISGTDAFDRSGASVSGAGDVNGDGLADVIVGAYGAGPYGTFRSNTGESYVVFGKTSTTPVELSDVAAGMGGFVINGIDAYDDSGFSVSGAGDVNGDGLADLIVGARFADPGGNTDAGESYVVFGKASTTAVELSDVASGMGGFIINGIDPDDVSGLSVSGAGDVNGDGLADLIVGALSADPGGKTRAGESYVVFGKTDGTAVELSTVASGTGGFIINGIDVGDASGISVSGAGDVNGDGLADLIVGALNADPDGKALAGESYVVFGKASGTAVELSDVALGTGGFVINGIDIFDQSGISVSGAGDVNGDGLADFIIGANAGDPIGNNIVGESYVVFSPEVPVVVDSDGDGLTDAEELDIAQGSICPDPNNPDSDGDGLSDGDEVLLFGTSPCNADTDGDGITDDVDPTPLDPGVPGDFLEEFLRDLADQVAGLDPALIDAPNANSAAGRQNAMANKIRQAANLLADGDIQGAIDELQSLLLKLDGDSNPPDWMLSSDEKAQLNLDIATVILLLELLLMP